MAGPPQQLRSSSSRCAAEANDLRADVGVLAQQLAEVAPAEHRKLAVVQRRDAAERGWPLISAISPKTSPAPA